MRAVKQNAVIGIGGFLIAFLAFELFLRLPNPLAFPRKYLWPLIFDAETAECRTSDPVLHHRLESLCQGRVRIGDDFDIEFETNSFGLRSPEISLEKPEGVYRILVLGDSFTEGWGVEEDETFSGVIERELNHDSDIRYEVINAGVGSYSPILELTYLMEYGIDFDPDLVFVMVDSNDVKDDYKYGGWDRHRETVKRYFDREFDETKVWPERGNLSKTLESSEAASFMYLAIKSNLDSRNRELTYESVKANNTINANAVDWEGYERMFDLTGENLRLMNEYLNQRDIPLVASVSSRGLFHSADAWCPGREQWGFECGRVYDPAPIRELEKKIWDAGIPYLDTYQSLVRSGEDELYYPNDGHWTAKAHEIVGKTIATELLDLPEVLDKN